VAAVLPTRVSQINVDDVVMLVAAVPVTFGPGPVEAPIVCMSGATLNRPVGNVTVALVGVFNALTVIVTEPAAVA
jgi:hypothetical protein